MYFDYFNILVFAGVGLVFVFANLLIASVVRPKHKTEQGLETYECGEEAIGDAWVTFDIRYYTVALVYVIFAVEIAFLFPWALVLQSALAGTGVATGSGIGAFALVEGVIFIAILFLGLAYVWAKGDLDWVLTYSAPAYEPAPAPNRAVPSVQEIEQAQALAEHAEHEDEEGAAEGEEEAA